MLLGYNKDGEIKFIFTDEKYLENKYPNNTAKISNFWGTEKHGLTEFFVSINAFKDWDNTKNYRIVNGKLTKIANKEIKEDKQQPPIEKNVVVMEDNIVTKDTIDVTKSNKQIKGKKK